MELLDQKQLLFLKKNYFTSKQKTLCKKFEQYGGEFTFIVDDIKYKLAYNQSKAYSNFILNQDYMKHSRCQIRKAIWCKYYIRYNFI